MDNLELTTNVKNAQFITHNGKFHIDEIFATVLLTKIFDKVKLARISNVENIGNKKIIYDIGKGKYDHHQLNCLIRKDGVKYSSFGLLWKEFGRKFLEKVKCTDIEYVWNKIDNNFVKTIDKIDNFQIEDSCKKEYLISNVIEKFNPEWDLNEDSNEKFKQAVVFANIIFENEIKSVLAEARARNYLSKLEINYDKSYLVLEKFIPYEQYILENDKKNKIKFVIYPSRRNGYEIRIISNRAAFPIDWIGLDEKEFYNKYKQEGMLYCHSNGKLCIADSKENAVKIVMLLI